MAFTLAGLFGKSKKSAAEQEAARVGLQLRILSALMVLAIITAGAAEYFDTQTTTQGFRGIEESDQLQVLSQRVSIDVQRGLVGDRKAIDDLIKDRATIEEIINILDKGDATHRPASGTVRPVFDEVKAIAELTIKDISVVEKHRAALENLGDILQKIQRVNSEMRPLMNNLVAQLPSPTTTRFALFTSRTYSDLIALQDHDITQENFTALGNNVAEVQDALEKMPTTAVGLTEIKEKFSFYRESSEKLIASSRELIEAKKAGNAAVDDSKKFLEATVRLTEAYDATLQRRVTLFALIGSGVVMVLLIGAFAYVYLTDLRKRTREAERVNRSNQDSILRLMNEMGELADGDLTVKATVSEDITGAIADSVNFTVDELRKLVTGITKVSAQVTAATSATELVAKEQLMAAQKQSNEIRDAGESIDLITKSIQEVDASASQSLQVASRTLAVTEEGARAVQNTVKGMDEIREQIQETSKRIKRLGESSQEIGEIVDLISDITEQTNVLALNAAIQAASAGEAGRGFSVVAAEVQRLAERSAEATKQIGSLVKAIQGDTQDAIAAMETSTVGVVSGAKLANAAGQSLREVEQVSRELAALISSISVSTQVQTEMANDVAETMTGILQITAQTTEGTKRTSASVVELANLATGLKASVAGFKV